MNETEEYHRHSKMKKVFPVEVIDKVEISTTERFQTSGLIYLNKSCSVPIGIQIPFEKDTS